MDIDIINKLSYYDDDFKHRPYILTKEIIKTRLWFYALWSIPDGIGDASDKIFQTIVNNRVVGLMNDALVIQVPFSLRLVRDCDFDLL